MSAAVLDRGATAFRGQAGPLSNTCDQHLLFTLRSYADVVLIGADLVAERKEHRRCDARPGHGAGPVGNGKDPK